MELYFSIISAIDLKFLVFSVRSSSTRPNGEQQPARRRANPLMPPSLCFKLAQTQQPYRFRFAVRRCSSAGL